ncbi:YceD family protein [Oceanibium sediminis]|uniref:YceD family protein n=1 Tax=Oceanibium sediminis TaxID=2026339 RepID=UPI000DD355B7|nr:DUF177 domain-containing protein [Oceanibium sediminis]
MSPSASPLPEFSRLLRVARRNRNAPLTFEEEATPEEMEKLVTLMDLLSLRKLRFSGSLTPVDGGGWHLKGDLGATVSQPCVVTLAPVQSRIDRRVTRLYLPGGEIAATATELEIDPDEDDTIEPLTDSINLGLLAMEELALALPLYPRAKGVPDPEATRTETADSRENPFAALAGLKKKMEEDGD